MWMFLKKLKVELPCDPATPLMGMYLEKTQIQKKFMHPNVHNGAIYNNQDMGAT